MLCVTIACALIASYPGSDYAMEEKEKTYYIHTVSTCAIQSWLFKILDILYTSALQLRHKWVVPRLLLTLTALEVKRSLNRAIFLLLSLFLCISVAFRFLMLSKV